MGQKNVVKVFRLVSKYTAEEKIIEIASKKLLLESLIIKPLNNITKDDYVVIFKNATFELFNNHDDFEKEFNDNMIEQLISRNFSENDSF